MSTSDIEKRFEEYRKYLILESQKLTSFISVYRQLYEMEGAQLDAMKWAPGFFTTTEDALFTAIIIWAHKLFDPNSERGFFDFLSFVGSNLPLLALSELQRRTGFTEDYMAVRKPITTAEIREDRKRLSRITSLNSIKIRRDKFHAHFDGDYFFQRDKLQQDAPLKWSDLEKIEAAMDHVLNRYSSAYDATAYILKMANVRDLPHLLRRVR